jgi:hypothetical protein
MISPPGEDTQDAQRWWRAYLLAENDQADGWPAQRHEMELVRLSADLGDDHARRQLALWLARLRERASSGDDHARQVLAKWEC